MNDKTGGSAFPVPIAISPAGDEHIAYEGMTLRDYFASDALKAIIIHAGDNARASMLRNSNGFAIDRMEFAETAYQYADAMLLAREL